MLKTFICSISHEIMTRPVILSDGFTYDRKNIKKWFRLGKNRSPITNL